MMNTPPSQLHDLLREIRDRLSHFQDATELHGLVMRLDALVQSHEMRIATVEEDLQSSGDVYVDDLKKKLTTYETSQQHWVRYVVGVIVSILIVVIAAGLGYLLHK